MFSYIKGTVQYKDSNMVVIENNGIGYNIYTSLQTLGEISEVGTSVAMYTYMSVKEDGISLYGFARKEELNIFKMLISVSGIGPKVARAILSTLSPSKFALALLTKDEKALIRAPGIGKKAAQRIILELQDKITQEELSIMCDDNIESMVDNNDGGVIKEAISALTVLGYDYDRASDAVTKIYQEGIEVEKLVKMALKSSAG